MAVTHPLIDWGCSVVKSSGEAESGDMHLVKPVGRGVLVAAVDGAGHGAEAARAARIAISTLREHAGEGIAALLRLCHQKLKGTRGAVMSLVSFDGERNEMKWLGVGNVSGLLVRPQHGKEGMMVRGGVVGYRLPPLQTQVVPVQRGDTLTLATDGISPDFIADVDPGTSPRELAPRLCERYATGRDDAMLVVVRYLGWNA